MDQGNGAADVAIYLQIELFLTRTDRRAWCRPLPPRPSSMPIEVDGGLI